MKKCGYEEESACACGGAPGMNMETGMVTKVMAVLYIVGFAMSFFQPEWTGRYLLFSSASFFPDRVWSLFSASLVPGGILCLLTALSCTFCLIRPVENRASRKRVVLLLFLATLSGGAVNWILSFGSTVSLSLFLMGGMGAAGGAIILYRGEKIRFPGFSCRIEWVIVLFLVLTCMSCIGFPSLVAGYLAAFGFGYLFLRFAGRFDRGGGGEFSETVHHKFSHIELDERK